MNDIKVIIIIIGLMCTATWCENEKCHKSLPFRNNSEKTIYITCSANKFPNDTIPSSYSFSDFYKSTGVVKPHNTNNSALFTMRKYCFEDEHFYVRIFVYDNNIVQTFPFDTICKYYMVLQRYDLTVSDLQRLNWTITYPPDERMKNVKMYPPYQE